MDIHFVKLTLNYINSQFDYSIGEGEGSVCQV